MAQIRIIRFKFSKATPRSSLVDINFNGLLFEWITFGNNGSSAESKKKTSGVRGKAISLSFYVTNQCRVIRVRPRKAIENYPN